MSGDTKSNVIQMRPSAGDGGTSSAGSSIPRESKSDIYINHLNSLDGKVTSMIQEVSKLASGGGGGYNGGMDAWQNSVESRLGELRSDISGLRSFLLIAYGAGFLAMLGILWTGFSYVSARADRTHDRLFSIESSIAEIKTILTQPKAE